MVRKRVVGWGTAAALAALLSFPLMGWATPSEEMRETFEQVIKILSNPDLKPAEKTKERRAAIRQVVGRRFNFAEMARGAWPRTGETAPRRNRRTSSGSLRT